MELLSRFELPTSSLPRTRSTAELQEQPFGLFATLKVCLENEAGRKLPIKQQLSKLICSRIAFFSKPHSECS